MSTAPTLPVPQSAQAGRSLQELTGTPAFISRAALWRPKGAYKEVTAATASRIALMLIDRTDGKAYSADELQTKILAESALQSLPTDLVSPSFTTPNIGAATATSINGAELVFGLDDSLKVGHSNTASGNYVSAIGCGNTASGIYSSSAIGSSNNASGDYSSAVGYNNTAEEVRASAFGYHNTASGLNSSAFGYQNTASDDFSTAVGYLNSTTSSIYGHSSAIGYGNTASESYASAIGSSNLASGDSSSAVGGYNTASGASSSAFGCGNTASGAGSLALGRLNTASGVNSSAFGYKVTTTTENTEEFGHWLNETTRGGAVRIHGNGAVALTLCNTATALTDGGATHGSEAYGTLIREGYAIRRNGNVILIDINVGGTIKTLSLGTAS